MQIADKSKLGSDGKERWNRRDKIIFHTLSQEAHDSKVFLVPNCTPPLPRGEMKTYIRIYPCVHVQYKQTDTHIRRQQDFLYAYLCILQ